MNTIPENSPAEMTLGTDCILSIKENDPISHTLHSEANLAESIAKTIASKDGHMRRNSTGNIGIPYKSVKILSRYLATTTNRSSCHDNCKYGISQDFDMNVLGCRALKTIAQKHSRGYYHMGKTEVLPERKQKSTVNLSPTGSRSQKPDSPPVAARREISSNRKGDLYQQFSLPLQGLVPRSKPTLSKLSMENHSGSKESGADVRVNLATATCVQNLDGTSSNRKQTIRNVKEETTNKLNRKKVSSRAAVPLSSLHSVKKGLTRPALAPKRPGKRYTSPKTENLKTLKVVSHLNSDAPSKQPKPEILTMKTLTRARYKQETKQETFLSESSTSQNQKITMEKRSTNAEAAKIKPTRGRVVRANDKEPLARKLSFRQGKVIENEAVMNPSRRLKFKQRSLSDTIVVDFEKITSNLGHREVNADGSEMNGVNSEKKNKVSLKHKDGDEDKKGPQNLLNNMIEETANKLAETKKSKVKVLVGAFETVISLREQKPQSMVDSSPYII
ncbi:Plant calmodulin-binding protein-related [Euphorbia peplus]|nr:Plant calmodulin-binding protein-related [Euphorbia peplus]